MGPIEIKKNGSWYKMLTLWKSGYSYYIPTNACTLFWATLYAVIFRVGFSIMLFSTLLWLGVFNIIMFGGFVLFTDLPLYTSELYSGFAGAGQLVMFFYVACFVVLLFTGLIDLVSKSRKVDKVLHTPVSTILVGMVPQPVKVMHDAIKEKYCPVVNYVK